MMIYMNVRMDERTAEHLYAITQLQTAIGSGFYDHRTPPFAGAHMQFTTAGD